MKQVIVYFANWYLGRKPALEGGEVASIPWDKVSSVNHAFWSVAPADQTTETTFEWRENHREPRKNFKIVSMHPEMDYEDTGVSEVDASMGRSHFAQYAVYAEKYPDVTIMISIGGWTRCGYFSEMAYTKEGRQSCIASCVDLIQQYPWIDGIDIDWEYPAGSVRGEREPADEEDEGCPIFGTDQEDSDNFVAFLAELRQGLDEAFGKDVKRLTACAGASVTEILFRQDWSRAVEYLDTINLMTYDLVGVWDGHTGHTSSLLGADVAVKYLMSQQVSPHKICVGTPLYASSFLMKGRPVGKIVGAEAENYRPTALEITTTKMRELETEAVNDVNGWHLIYDETEEAPYLYNDDESSAYYNWFLSYENPLSLQAKLNYINQNELAGIIVWECSQDTIKHDMIAQMSKNLRK